MGWVTFAITATAATSPTSTIHWSPGGPNLTHGWVEVRDNALARSLRASTTNETDWNGQHLLSVYAGQHDLLSDVAVPAMLGEYRIENETIRFYPRYPWVPRMTYRAVFRPSRLPSEVSRKIFGSDTPGTRLADVLSEFRLPERSEKRSTRVSHIFPSADRLPENLLKFYLHFSAPMQGGHIYEYIRLRDTSGESVELPFLEIDEELWNSDMTRLTLFIDPGRIKRGVRPLEEIGPALEQGKRYTLEIDANWRDHHGQPLVESFRKSFTVEAPDREAPDPTEWQRNSLGSGTRAPLVLQFPEPMDHALSLRMIRIVDSNGQWLAGDRSMEDQERQWLFRPEKPWTAGRHQIVVQNTIEDLAGNNIGKTFEVDLFDTVQRRLTNQVIRIPFEVR